LPRLLSFAWFIQYADATAAFAVSDVEGSKSVRAAQAVFTADLAVIVATLSGTNAASAEGIHVNCPSPIIALARKLIEVGYDSALPMIVVRNGEIALRITHIGKAARLRVRGNAHGFEAKPCRPTGPPMRANAPVGTGHRGAAE
jgi:hypothetical protein